MASFRPKYIIFELNRYRGVMFDGTKDWSKIWSKTDLCFQNRHGNSDNVHRLTNSDFILRSKIAELNQNKNSKQPNRTDAAWKLYFRGGFRGGDLVTCHPLFLDMTLQSQILVIESLFLTSVSKYIRKYLLSDNFHACTPLALIPL